MSSSLRATVLLAVWLSLPLAAGAQQAPAPVRDSSASTSMPATEERTDASAARGSETPGQGVATLVRDILGDFAHLPSMANVPPAAVGSAGALFAHNFDDEINRRFYGTGAVDAFFAPGKTIGQTPVQMAAGVLTYVIGRSTAHPKVTHVGIDLIRAQVVTGLLTVALKEAVRRERPDGSGHGSFPSGHASVTFASASVLAAHFSLRVSIPMYLLATYVATSRLHENVHWMSDVVAGSTLGYIVGRTVTRHGRENFALVPVLQPHGAALVVTRVW